MNFGVTSLAAPNAASSSTARYSSTARPAASGGRPAAPSTRVRSLASAWIRLASTAKPSPPTRPFVDAALQHGLEQPAQQITVAEAAMPVLRESRVIGHLAIEAQPAKPAVGQVQVDLLAQPPLRADAEAVADDQHPDQQLRIDRRPSHLAVERRQLRAAARRVRQTGRSTAAGARPAHAVRAKTRRTERPAGRGVPPSSAPPRSPGPD